MTTYIDGLKMLARRELSELQVRQRLARKGDDRDAIDAAVARVGEERGIDETRGAEENRRHACRGSDRAHRDVGPPPRQAARPDADSARRHLERHREACR